MTEKLELLRGSGNVFRVIGFQDADLKQAKALLAAEVIGVLDDENLSVRAAEKRTGIAYADFSRIRNADLDHFTIDRLMITVSRLGRKVEVRVCDQKLEPV